MFAPHRIELDDLDKSAKILINAHAGEIGKIVGFENEEYQIELLPYSGATAPMTFSFPPNHVRVLNGDSHVGSLTSAGVVDQLKQDAKAAAEPYAELVALRKQVTDLKAANTALDEKAIAAQSTAASHLAANVKLNEKLVAIETAKHPADDEALKMVERERDEVKHELEISRQQVAMFAKRLKAQKRQQVEVETLKQELTTFDSTVEADEQLATYLNKGWTIINFAMDIGFQRRVVTLSRPIRTTPTPPKRETRVEEPTPARVILGDAYVFPAMPQPVFAGEPVTLNGQPISFKDAVKLSAAGLIDIEEAIEVGNARVRNILSQVKPAAPVYRPLLSTTV